jgi:pyrroline-5-carboxylate reductase
LRKAFSLSFGVSNCYKAAMSSDLSIGFFGAGKMATALAKGFVGAGLVAGNRVVASDPMEAARKAFVQAVGGAVAVTNAEVAERSRVLLLAVKPDQAGAVLSEVKPAVSGEHLLISIAAGVTLARLEAGLRPGARVARVMPNAPALVGASASAFALGTAARGEDEEMTRRLFSAVGTAVAVKESLLDAVTGLSGSGPGYVFLILEALIDGGVAAGLPREIATQLAAQTLLGSAKLLLETGQHPGALKDMVTSPGGTTIDGLQVLERAGVRGALIEAVRAAADKSRRLGAS